MTTTADTRSNAQRYADSIAAEIWKWDKDGEPFGVNEYALDAKADSST